MISNILVDSLRKLTPSGQNSFESLISELIRKLTGRRFYLAQAGSQSGRDMSSDRQSGNIIAVECKRYGKDTELDQRELLGELAQVTRSIPDLDLWVLVASRSISSQLFEILTQEANSKGIEFFAFSSNDGSPSSLEVLCANEVNITIGYIQRSAPNDDLTSLMQSLESIKSSQGFYNELKGLKNSLLNETIGYENWRLNQNEWFINNCETKAKSRAAFKQILNVTDAGAHLIPRLTIWDQLDQWLLNWRGSHSPCILEGEEGDGKTWTVASWLSNRIKSSSIFPAVLFLPSISVSSENPKTLLEEAINLQTNEIGKGNNIFRISRWIERNTFNNPLLILVLDGINERRAPAWWRGLLETLMGPAWESHIGLIVTCRTTYWNKYFGNLDYFQPKTYPVPPYNDEELAEALKQYGLVLSDIPQSVFTLIRKPRYFDLMVRFRDKMADSGDITPARLIYEDWRDRYERKTNLPLSNLDFQDLILNIARKNRAGVEYNLPQELDFFPSIQEEKQNILQELVTGNILQNVNGQYRVEPKHLGSSMKSVRQC